GGVRRVRGEGPLEGDYGGRQEGPRALDRSLDRDRDRSDAVVGDANASALEVGSELLQRAAQDARAAVERLGERLRGLLGDFRQDSFRRVAHQDEAHRRPVDEAARKPFRDAQERRGLPLLHEGGALLADDLDVEILRHLRRGQRRHEAAGKEGILVAILDQQPDLRDRVPVRSKNQCDHAGKDQGEGEGDRQPERGAKLSPQVLGDEEGDRAHQSRSSRPVRSRKRLLRLGGWIDTPSTCIPLESTPASSSTAARPEPSTESTSFPGSAETARTPGVAPRRTLAASASKDPRTLTISLLPTRRFSSSSVPSARMRPWSMMPMRSHSDSASSR